MSCEEPRRATFSARIACQYLLHVPDAVDSRTALIVALHGFASTPEAMLTLTCGLAGARHVIAALEGPHQFYLSTKTEETACGWGTHRHPMETIRLHHDMVRTVLEEAGSEFNIPRSRRVLAGFSQPVALNYRFAATFPEAAGGVIALCGGLPSDWEEAPYHKVQAAVLHIARKSDEFYPVKVVEQYPERLRMRADDVEFHILEGSHRVPSKAGPIIRPWLERIVR
ncbi:MAG: alpha/beta hydrolase [Bryobacteraceae bacterium]